MLAAQFLLKIGPKHCDLPVIAAASLGDTGTGRRWLLACATCPPHTGFSRSGPRDRSSCFSPGPETGEGMYAPQGLTGLQSSGLGSSCSSSGRQSRASKYSHWSRGKNFLETA